MAAKDIQHPIAADRTGELVLASDAERESGFTCVSCNSPMILRRSGLKGPRRKRPHFAHKNVKSNCSPESSVHFGFKTIAYEILKSMLLQKQGFPFHWECSDCMGSHEGDLLKVATRIELEHDLGTCVPDLVLLKDDGQILAAIEIVVTHPPEETVVDYYSRNRIILIQYTIHEEDLKDVGRRLAMPDIVAICPNPKCKRCGGHKGQRKLMVIDTTCYACSAPMKVALGNGTPNSPGLYNELSEHGPVFYPRKFSNADIRIARDHGVDIRRAHKGTRQDYRDNACHCSSCNRWRGTTYIDRLAREALKGRLPYVFHHLGYECAQCDV